MEPLPQAPGLPAALPTARYARHRPEATLLYELVDRHYPPFHAALERDGRSLPTFVQQEFAAYLKCGRLEHGFLRVRCTQCHAERLVAFSCKRRGFCPSCGARRMVETAALLVDAVLPLAQNAWLPVVRTLGARLWSGGRLIVPRASQLFDEAGSLSDEAMATRLAAFVAGFVDDIRSTSVRNASSDL